MVAWWVATAALLSIPVGGAVGDTSDIATSSTSSSHGSTTSPHVIWIVADDLGHADVSYHTGTWATPNIDSLANEGVKLEQYYVQVRPEVS